MLSKRVAYLGAVIAVLLIAGLACGGGAAPASAPPQATQGPAPKPTAVTAEEIEIVNLTSYVDRYDYFHIAGEIRNNSDRPLSNIEFTVEIKDASGNTLLKDDNDQPTDTLTFSPLLNTLAPGEVAPLDYYLSTDKGMPDTYNVTVSGFQTGEADRAQFKAENTQMFVSDGSIYIVGELVNQSDQAAEIHGMAGAALDSNDAVAAADYTLTLTRRLAPAGDQSGKDRTPFLVTIDGASDGDYANWAVYVDADVTDEEASSPVNLELAGAYFDTYGSFHAIGTATNAGTEALTVSLVAGVYDSDGMVLDAATTSLPVYLVPDATVPFHFGYFTTVNSDADLAGKVDNYSVQVDSYWTFPTSFDVVELETTNDDNADQGDGVWKFTGDVANTSGKDLSSVYIIVAVHDKDGNLVGTDYTSVYPEGDAIAAGDTVSFEVTVYMDPSLDTTDFTFATIVQGIVK